MLKHIFINSKKHILFIKCNKLFVNPREMSIKEIAMRMPWKAFNTRQLCAFSLQQKLHINLAHSPINAFQFQLFSPSFICGEK